MVYYDILNKFENHGFEAYIVGGYVRDHILGKPSIDADVITNALPSEISLVFGDAVLNIFERYGAVKLKVDDSLVDVTTFRRELSYVNGKPSKVEFIGNVKEDLLRRDFTINTLCMNKDNVVFDYLGIMNDFDLGIIKTIRDTKQVLFEDPSRMIRALRFMSELNFSLDTEIHNFILENKELFYKISYVKRKQELDKLFNSGSSMMFFDYIKKFGLEEFLGIFVSDLFVDVKSNIGVWAQINVSNCYNFSKLERKQIKIVKILLSKGFIEKYDLYVYGLDICLIVADILSIDKKNLSLLYTNLVIKDIMDICISADEICSLLNVSSKLAWNYLKIIEKEIVNGTLFNDYNMIVDRVKEWGDLNV
ncbi:MAG: hypothetical protein HFE04_03630 [Bacilli bacterium]|nr:hypothetical protein [Bacilli bacterium]